MNARRFLFDTDFRPRPDNPVAAKEAAALAETVARAEAEGYARGLREGQALAEQQIQARLSDALTRVGLAAAGLIGQSDARDQAREDEALDFAILLARKIAGEALDAQPLAAIGDAARAALQHLRGVPHLVVRVHESLVDDSEALVKRLARERGFEGRLVVLGEPDLAPGDARMEWADGGVVRDRAQIEAAVLSALGLPA
ncbi:MULTISPECIES: FliH/SctL family protein [unclassified Methylobacterium]|uniref:FliH/SctL family protein n=1 Tax=unclassified Methylobacterium TaxID=2615210 RepID=UPI0006FE0DF6|nr:MULTISPECIES: FliH/SctL family protein [unclassified Methylobacterium]KQO67176.1 flagellar assembly protein FliH [Methylobacterium sp. Leaf89]KQO74258.1 flagellar assembly protein FliH [Methylobacterium sp. Leaf88]KQT84650.1 flagellar assembly protein FliH [Methylobacterium sp. Leaf465]